MPLEDLYDDNQKTSAIGHPPMMGVTQGGPMDATVAAVAVLAGGFDRVEDARKIAFAAGVPAGLSPWPKMSEATGIHAEMMIVRAWLIRQMSHPTASTLQQALASLQGRMITASQPACWYCHAYMTSLGIIIADNVIGRKPMTAWRHPVTGAIVANGDMPASYGAVLASM